MSCDVYVRVGSFASFWRSAGHFQVTTISGHSQGMSARLKSANSGSEARIFSQYSRPTFTS